MPLVVVHVLFILWIIHYSFKSLSFQGLNCILEHHKSTILDLYCASFIFAAVGYCPNVTVVIECDCCDRAEEELVLINQIYTDVLSKEKSRELYNQLCKFRKVSGQDHVIRIAIRGTIVCVTLALWLMVVSRHYVCTIYSVHLAAILIWR